MTTAASFDEDDQHESLEIDYGSDSDDDNVYMHGKIDDEDSRYTAELSKRTNDLMDNYRSYVDGMDDDDDDEEGRGGEGGALSGSGDNDLAGDVPLVSIKPVNYYRQRSTDSIFANSANINMLRDFTIDEEDEDTTISFQQGLQIRLDAKRRRMDNDPSEGYGSRTSKMIYMHAWMRSKRVKRAIIIIALAFAAVAIVSSMVSAKRKRDLPDWDNELNKMTEDEKDHNNDMDEGASIMTSPSEPLEKHPGDPSNAGDEHDYETSTNKQPELQLDQTSMDGDAQQEEWAVEPVTSQQVGVPMQPIEEEAAMAQELVPPPSENDQIAALYASTYEQFHPVKYDRYSGWDGQTYGDALVFCASKDGKMPCPYEAICPMRSDGPPSGGIEDGLNNGDWVPIMDSANGWVSVGHGDTCMKYNDVNSHPPNWGLTGKENEAITRHVRCCDKVEGTGHIMEGEVEFTMSEVSKAEELILDTMHPIWFGREDGYHGTTYEEAEIFCMAIGHMALCPVDIYCPNGPRDSRILFLQRDAYDGEQWAPAMGNNWIMIGALDGDTSSTCQQYEQLYGGKSPPWTADGSHNEVKEHVLCCMQQDATKHEQDIARSMNPIWLDTSHGWSGGSHADGEKFCNGLDGKRLCPYDTYCPHGPGMNPMGGHSVDFNLEGEQWAPMNGENEWVMVGRKYGNSATMCYTHEALEGGPPDWGSTRDNPGVKLHIQCCSF